MNKYSKMHVNLPPLTQRSIIAIFSIKNYAEVRNLDVFWQQPQPTLAELAQPIGMMLLVM
jgi:hypothetical protein